MYILSWFSVLLSDKFLLYIPKGSTLLRWLPNVSYQFFYFFNTLELVILNLFYPFKYTIVQAMQNTLNPQDSGFTKFRHSLFHVCCTISCDHWSPLVTFYWLFYHCIKGLGNYITWMGEMGVWYGSQRFIFWFKFRGYPMHSEAYVRMLATTTPNIACYAGMQLVLDKIMNGFGQQRKPFCSHFISLWTIFT